MSNNASSHKAYYNEIDSYCAQWLRNLIAAGHIAPGVVDERDIRDIAPNELAGFTQCHFFAGIGGWSLALRIAGWPDDRPVWTASCPCQPFSAAGRGGGFADERHLWPHAHWLIRQCRPDVVFGEQVASKDGLAWLDLVQADMEGEGYAFGAADLCSAGAAVGYAETEAYKWLQRAILNCPDPVLAERLSDFAEWACGELCVGAPHIRQRLHWVANSRGERLDGQPIRLQPGQSRQANIETAGRSAIGVALGDASGQGLPLGERDGRVQRGTLGASEGQAAVGAGGTRELADTNEGQRRRIADGARSISNRTAPGRQQGDSEPQSSGVLRGFWSGADWIECRDGKARPVESGTFPLAYGVSGRVGRLRAYGNAINPWLAAEFIGAYLDCGG